MLSVSHAESSAAGGAAQIVLRRMRRSTTAARPRARCRAPSTHPRAVGSDQQTASVPLSVAPGLLDLASARPLLYVVGALGAFPEQSVIHTDRRLHDDFAAMQSARTP